MDGHIDINVSSYDVAVTTPDNLPRDASSGWDSLARIVANYPGAHLRWSPGSFEAAVTRFGPAPDELIAMVP
jgi:hypothetical protein